MQNDPNLPIVRVQVRYWNKIHSEKCTTLGCYLSLARTKEGLDLIEENVSAYMETRDKAAGSSQYPILVPEDRSKDEALKKAGFAKCFVWDLTEKAWNAFQEAAEKHELNNPGAPFLISRNWLAIQHERGQAEPVDLQESIENYI